MIDAPLLCNTVEHVSVLDSATVPLYNDRMNKDLQESIDVLALEFANKSPEDISVILDKCVYEGGISGEQAVHLLAALSQA